MEKCPVCEAPYRGKAQCHRCKSDLGRFKAIEQEADLLLSRAATALKQGDYSIAFDRARRSCWLKYSKEAQMVSIHAANLAQGG